MTKEIKKDYCFLDLPYSATEEDVKLNEKAMIKIIRAKAIKHQKDSKEDVQKVVDASERVMEYIKKNGVAEERQIFKASTERVILLIFILVLFIIMFVTSLIALL